MNEHVAHIVFMTNSCHLPPPFSRILFEVCHSSSHCCDPPCGIRPSNACLLTSNRFLFRLLFFFHYFFFFCFFPGEQIQQIGLRLHELFGRPLSLNQQIQLVLWIVMTRRGGRGGRGGSQRCSAAWGRRTVPPITDALSPSVQ